MAAPAAIPIIAINRASKILAVMPSGGAAMGTSTSIWLEMTSDSISDARTARLPRPNSAPNHSATIAGNSGWLLTGTLL